MQFLAPPIPRLLARRLARPFNQCRDITAKAIILSLWLLLTCGCSSEDIEFYPLSAGRIWHYKLVKTTMDGTFEQKFIAETLPPFQWLGTSSVPLVSAGGEQYLYQHTAQAIQRVAFKPRDSIAFVAHTEPYVVLPKNQAVGNTWQQVSHTQLLENTGPPWETLFRIAEPVTVSFSIEQNDSTVTVAAGTFHNCLKISGYGESNVDVGNYIGRTTIAVNIEQWYAADVGLVQSIRTETSSSDAISHGKLMMELEYSTN